MAATVASYTGDRLVTRSPESYPQQRRTGSDEGKGLRARIASLTGLWKIYYTSSDKSRTCRSSSSKYDRIGYTSSAATVRSDIKDMEECVTTKYQSRALLHTLDLLFSPPSYEECLADVPPDYTATDALAVVQGLVDVKLELSLPEAGLRQSQRRTDIKVDLTEPKGIRYHAKKKKGAAAKKNAWADEEEKKEEPPADEGAGGDAGGGDGAGDAGGGDAGGGDGGGDPPGGDGGGGDDPDDIWGAVGGGKKKKKKKKNAW
jgi:hypothetical protein